MNTKVIGTVCDKDMCAGCMACIEVCSKGAISIVDNLQSYNAIIDNDKCIQCNMCHKVCPQSNSAEYITPTSWKQGWANDSDERIKSSSGGYATAIAKAFTKNNGTVCSCVFKGGEFVFDFATTIEECDNFRGSKYIKSSPEDVYKKIKDMLKDGKRILFIGLPCQVAGVKNFVGSKFFRNLYTVDLICHGTPSPKLLKMYLDKDIKIPVSEIDNIDFRKKTQYGLYCNNKKILPQRVQDRYTKAFLDGLDYTENCYNCKYARVDRISDISLGDAWGSSLPMQEKKKGISLALCQTDKGNELLEQADIYMTDIDRDIAIRSNRQLNSPSKKPDKRKSFYKKLNKYKNFKKAVAIAYPIECIKQDIKTYLYKLNILK